jgi:hypothetical protein
MSYKLTDELLEVAKSSSGGYFKNQLEIIGVSWPPKKGWKKKVKNRTYSKEVIKKFILYDEGLHF